MSYISAEEAEEDSTEKASFSIQQVHNILALVKVHRDGPGCLICGTITAPGCPGCDDGIQELLQGKRRGSLFKIVEDRNVATDSELIIDLPSKYFAGR